jgi:hypothetical protein
MSRSIVGTISTPAIFFCRLLIDLAAFADQSDSGYPYRQELPGYR